MINNTSDWALLFDLDGVLIDSEGIYTAFWHNIDLHFPTGVENFEYVIKGNTLENILDTYFADDNDKAQILAELKEHERTMEYCYFDGVEDFLNSMHSRGIPSAIVTSSNAEKMRHLFSQLPSLRTLIDLVVTGDDVTHSKPHPQGYLLAAERLGIDPARCIVFEDSMAGVEAGRRAGAAVVGIATTNPRERLTEFADIVVDSVSEIDFDTLYALVQD